MRRRWKTFAFLLIPILMIYSLFMYANYVMGISKELIVAVPWVIVLIGTYLSLEFTKRWCRSWLVVAISFAALYAFVIMTSGYLAIPNDILSYESFFGISQGRITIKETPPTFISLAFSFLAIPDHIAAMVRFHNMTFPENISAAAFLRKNLSPVALGTALFLIGMIYIAVLSIGTTVNAVRISISPRAMSSRLSESLSLLKKRSVQATLAVLAISIAVVFAVGRGRETAVKTPSDREPVVETPSDAERPQPPSLLRGVTRPHGVVELAWEPSPSSNIKEYRIYVGELDQSWNVSRFRLAATVLSDQHRWQFPKMELVYFSKSNRWGVQHPSQWFDGNTELVLGQPYRLRVQAVDYAGLESAPVFYDSYAIGGGVSRFDGHKWQVLTAVDRLASNWIYQVVEDSQGHLWFTTDSGVSRYDGQEWEHFTGEGVPSYYSSLVADTQDNLWYDLDSGVGRYDGKEWRTLTITDGLLSDVVRSMVMDDQGSLWFGTVGGVTQYDKGEWRTFTPRQSLADNVVNSVFEDKRHNFWFLTMGGLSLYDGVTWKTFTTEDGLASNVVYSIFEDSLGILWFTTNAGVSCYDGQEWRSYTAEDGLASSYVSSMIEDAEGNLWSVTDEGISRYDRHRWQTLAPGTEVPILLESERVHAVLQDPSNTLWFVMDTRLASYDGHTWQTFAYPAGFEVPWAPFFLQDAQGNLWLQGISAVGRYDGRKWRIFTDDEIGLSDPWIQTSVEDGQGNIWFGTNRGITIYDGHSWHRLGGGNILSALKDSRGNLWFATYDGVLRYGGQQWQTFGIADGLADNVVYSILEDSHRRLWFATGGGVSCFDGQNWQNFAVEGNLASGIIRAVVTDKEGRLWFATQGGVSCYDGHTWQSFTTADGLASNSIAAIVVDGQGDIWVGTFGDGVSRYDGRHWQTFTTEYGLAGDNVRSIIMDEHGDLWFCTDEGVSHYDHKTWQNFTIADGLTSNYVKSASKDRHGKLWFITGEGVNRYDGHGWQSFTVANGLPSGNVTSVLEDRHGNLWFSTVSSTRQMDKVEFPWLALIWSLLPLPGIPFVAYTCSHLPSTKVKRLSKRVKREPELFYTEIHHLLIEESPGLLTLLAEEAQQHQQTDLSRVVDAFGSLAYGKASVQDRLGNLVEVLTTVKEYPGGQELGALYKWLALASQVDTVAKASECEMDITPNPVDGTYMASSSVGDISALPLFLGSHLPEVLAAFGKTAETLSKYQQVESLSDKLVYLTDALTEIDGAQSVVEELAEPEKSIIGSISARWREVIAQEIANVSGRAKLKAELRTRQMLFGERVTLALCVENIGQAVAENVTVSLESSEEYEVIGEATVKLAGVSTRRPSDLEFTIHPKREDRVRLDFTITWDDREEQDKSRRFADTVSFVEVEREFTRIPSPYVAGNPITSPKLFFGREDVFGFVLENLVGAEQKNTLVLHGQRRTGKSSVLLQLRDRVLPQEFIPVYINMEALPDVKTMEAFLARLAYEIGRAARKRGLELEVPADFSGQPATTFDRFMDAAEDVLGGQRFVVMFDEFELIESKIAQGMDAGVLNYFRNLMQHRDSLVFVFTGTHRLQEMTHDYWSILFSIALNREISFLEEEDTRRLITEPVQDHLEYDDLTIEKIIRVTHCQPYLVQLICWQLVNYLNGQQRNYATINDVDEVLDQTLVTAEAYFNSIWEQSTSHQRLVLALLTGLLRPGKETAALSEVEKGLADKAVAITGHELIAALSELCRRDVLEERTNGELRYRFQIDLVRMWVEKNKPLSRVLIEEGL